MLSLPEWNIQSPCFQSAGLAEVKRPLGKPSPEICVCNPPGRRNGTSQIRVLNPPTERRLKNPCLSKGVLESLHQRPAWAIHRFGGMEHQKSVFLIRQVGSGQRASRSAFTDGSVFVIRRVGGLEHQKSVFSIRRAGGMEPQKSVFLIRF